MLVVIVARSLVSLQIVNVYAGFVMVCRVLTGGWFLMNAAPQVSVSVDTTNLQRAIDLASKQTRGSLQSLLGYTAYYVAVYAQKYLPAADMQTIDNELDETINVGTRPGNTMTMGQAIVLARMNPDSRFNAMTSNRWAIARPDLQSSKFEKAYGDAGMARRVLWEIIENVEEKMRSARHSSTHFLKSGWKSVKMRLKAERLIRVSGADLDVDDNPQNRLDIMPLGNIDFNGAGTNRMTLMIENKVGTDAKYPRLAEEHNRALLDYGKPALDHAIALQTQWMRDKYLPRAFGEIQAAWESVPSAGAFVPGTHNRLLYEAEDAAAGAAGAELEAFT